MNETPMDLRLVLVLTPLALLPCARGADLAATIDRDTINITLRGPHKMALMHVPSGAVVEINFDPNIIDFGGNPSAPGGDPRGP
jgi:hypothetical protein